MAWGRKIFTQRRLKATLVKGGGILLGASLLFVFISWLGFNPVVANILRTITTTTAKFFGYRHFAWKDRRTLSAKTQGKRYACYQVATTLTNQAAFSVLVFGLAVPYLWAYAGCTIAMGLLSYIALERVFQ